MRLWQRALFFALPTLTDCGSSGRETTAASRLTSAAVELPVVAVGPQYDTTHVYVPAEDVDRFAQSFLATFGGTSTRQVVTTVTPTPSSTTSQLLQTPVGSVSLFGYRTPVPYPFGGERMGCLVMDLEVAVKAARAAGADVVVEPYPDPIGRDVVIQWPGGVEMQLYVHFTKPSYTPFQTVPESRIYLSADRSPTFVDAFVRFAHGRVTSDQASAPGVEIGRPGETYRKLQIDSGFGKFVVLVTDGHLPYPYGRELTGYEVEDLAATLTTAKAAGVSLVAGPYTADHRQAAMVMFPGGYIAEIHATAR